MTQIIITCSYHVHRNLKQFTRHESSHVPSWKRSKPWCYTNHPCTALAPSGQLRVWKLPHGFYICSNKILTITVNIVSCENTAAERLAFSFNYTCNYNYTHNLEWSTCHCYSCLNYCYELMELPCLIRDGDCWKTEGREAVLNMTLVAIVPVHHLLQYFATHAQLTRCHGNAFNMH